MTVLPKGGISCENDNFIREGEAGSNDTELSLSIVKHYNSRRRNQLSGLFIRRTLSWTIFRKSVRLSLQLHQFVDWLILRYELRPWILHRWSIWTKPLFQNWDVSLLPLRGRNNGSPI